METDLRVEFKSNNWREIKQKKRKWKEERLMKKLKKMEEICDNRNGETTGTKSDENTCELSTVSIAVPGSILQNVQSDQLRTYVTGQIARAACIYKINEIVIFDDGCDSLSTGGEPIANSKTKKCCIQFARLLQYLECPQYLRKHFFPIHPDLQCAGIMNPLDAPHHLRQDENFTFREGVTTDKLVKNGVGTYVEVGLKKQVLVDKTLQPGLRVTVKINTPKEGSKKLRGIIVTPDAPERELNVYWGYSVRIAHSISEVFSKSPYRQGYDLTIGTSDKGKNIDEVKKCNLRNFKHVVIVFGGLQGLKSAVDNDPILKLNDASLLFDYYINTCPKQGSRTIRTEEAIFISLAELRKKLFGKSKLSY